MARVGTYLNFDGRTEEAFRFYAAVFETDFVGGIRRMGDAPMPPGGPTLSEADKRLVMHVELPITGGHLLMGTDTVAAFGQTVTMGTNVHISVEPDTRKEADRLFAALADGGKVTMQLADMFWGTYWGSLTDRFGVQWMVNCLDVPPG